MVRVQPRLPWFIAAASAIAAVNLVGMALLPTLLSYSPLLLIALSPLPRHLVLAAPYAAMGPLVAVATLRRMVPSMLGYAFGRAYGTTGIARMTERYPALADVVRWLQWLFDRAAPLVVFVAPTPVICAMAGATQMPLWLLLPVATAGEIVWTSLTYRLGEALSGWTKPLLGFFEEHTLSTTLGFIVLVLGYALLRRRQAQARLLHEPEA